MSNPSLIKWNKKWLTSPILIFIGILLGLIIGIYNKPLAAQLAPIGELYLLLMGMCILPIIMTAIVSSVGKSLRTKHLTGLLRRLFTFMLIGLLTAGLCGTVTALIIEPGSHLSGAGKELLSKKIAAETTANTTVNAASDNSDNFFNFISRIVPANIFNELSQGNTLAVVFFAILLGIALGKITTENAEKTLDIIHVLYVAFLRIVTWIMYGLPVGLCFLFTGYASKISWAEVTALAKLVMVIYACAGILIFSCSLLIWRKSRLGYFQSFAALKTPLLVAFGSGSSFAAIPAILNSLEQKLRLDRGIAELIVPLGVNLFRPGVVLQFVVAAIFVAQLYGQELTFVQLGILSFVAMFASLAVSGMPGIATAGIFALVLQPLGLPSAIGVILYITVLPILDPIVTLVNVHGNCTLAMLTRKKPNET